MTGQNKISDQKIGEDNNKGELLFWDIGEMAYTAMTRMNKLKAKGLEFDAEAMLKEWYI